VQFFFRTGRSTGVGVGPLGLLIVAPIYLAFLALVVAAYGAALLILFVVAALRAIRAHRGRKLHAPDG
jgi:hypothetical protein